ncbi:DUF885 family protein [Thioalkalivibrio sp. XN8]|uniref:DUF885 domain-containing protein n=1 Tax=Thioalkalivibrio sp. XN8 TaxID=2712863 RepID=UPI0013EAE90E|nr:DUF885 family protein [Thioalkalivibrio sp. XN8]NGP52266.1 DUF885 domain-containing protein [Thioalkalivibrio sp. XN8]
MLRLLVSIIAASLLAGCATVRPDPVAEFDALVADYEAWRLAQNPVAAGRQGDLEAAGRWPDGSFDAVAARNEANAAFLARLEAIDPDALDPRQQVSHAVLDYLLGSAVVLAAFEPERIAFTNDSGFFSYPGSLALSTRPRTVAEAEAWIRRIERIPGYFEQQVAWLRRGLETGVVQPAYILPGVITQVETLANTPAAESMLFAPLESLPAQVPAAERARLHAEALAAIEQHALPAYQALLAFFRDEYLAAPRETVGISAVPGGRDYYRELVRYHTTRDMTPEQVHEVGRAEVARIRAEMEKVIAQTGFEGSFAEFLQFLRTDPQFYARSEAELLMHAAWIAKRADDQMPRFFRNLPRLPYGVRPVPASMAPNYTTGRYWPGDLEGGVAGGYMVNTYALDQRPLYELPALTVHEGVPGHHHQFSVSQELEGVPEFRRQSYITAYGEGWGLYTEYLAIDMGLYTTPYEHFGRLTFEMWRACRLVIDTGIHWYGWTVEQAEACLLENSALAPHNVRTEVARYIAWPGQALAYKIGELLIRRLRSEAEVALGADFDIRAFHDHLLGEGGMPLSALEARMQAWIEEQEKN